jgi:hypothetical protein
MAPVTRSKAGDVPAVVAPARPTKDASNKAGKLTAAKRPAAAAAAAVKAEATTSKVQKRGSRKKRKGKGRKTPSPPSSAGKSEKSSSSNAAPRKTSSSRGSAPKRSASKKSDEASSSSKKSKTDKTPRLAAAAAANGSGQDDFPELAQAYGFMPFIDQAQRQPTSAPRTPRLATDHVLRRGASIVPGPVLFRALAPTSLAVSSSPSRFLRRSRIVAARRRCTAWRTTGDVASLE